MYQTGLIDDEVIETRPLDLDIAFQKEMENEDIVMNDDQDDGQDDQNDTSEAEDEGDKKAYITHKDIQAEVRRKREQPEVGFKLGSVRLISPLTESIFHYRKI